MDVERMRIHVVCYEDLEAWILGKMARRLFESVQALGMDVTLDSKPNPDAEINHHIIYYDYPRREAPLETVMLTHINDERELGKVRHQLVDCGVEMGICMSFETVRRLAHFGMPRTKLCFINPAHDGLITPKKTLIGITTRLYPDGCKREHLLVEACDTVSPVDYRFAIMGAGWEHIVDGMRARGFEVEYTNHFDADAYCRLMPTLDYFLYLGLDEGSMGFLDALAAGVQTIVTPQGFHLDIEGGITHAFESADDLRRVLTDIQRDRRRRLDSVAGLTWPEHARKHLLVWNYLRNVRAGKAIAPGLLAELETLGVCAVP